MKTIIKLILCCLIGFIFSCKKYLDLKPDKSLVIPSTLQDCHALLSNASVLGGGMPVETEIATNDFYLLATNYNSLASNHRDLYLWKSDADLNAVGVWKSPYERILVANQVLSVLQNIVPSADEQLEWNQVRGSALLLRSMCFLALANMFTQPYEPSTASANLGIPIKLTPSISENVGRGTLKETYDRIILDLEESISLLPAVNPTTPPTRSIAMPVKAAAQAALARVYLITGNYNGAFNAANSSLDQYNQLLDFNLINKNLFFSFTRFNSEVLYELSGPSNVPTAIGFVSKDLHHLYQEGDLRRELYFRTVVIAGDTSFKFKGGYNPGTIFSGLATNEMYLIRAECSARAGNITAAMSDLNALRKMRWDNRYAPLTSASGSEALSLILLERRRELAYTTLRWIDLRRLNKDPEKATILSRSLEGQTYMLPPNDLRYTFLIPREVLQRNELPQNPR